MGAECGIKSSNISLPSALEIELVFAGIPEHLILYGLILFFSMLIFLCCTNLLGCCSLVPDETKDEGTCTDLPKSHNRESTAANIDIQMDSVEVISHHSVNIDNIGEHRNQEVDPELVVEKTYIMQRKPLMRNVLFGKEDPWMSDKRGRSVLHYLKFLRLLLKIASIVFLFSLISLLINVSREQGQQTRFPATTISNLPEYSSFHWVQVVLGCLLPWIVVSLSMTTSREVGPLRQGTDRFNRTLIIEPCPNSKITTNEEYFQQEFKDCRVVRVASAKDYKNLDDLLDKLDFIEQVLAILAVWGEAEDTGIVDLINSCNRRRGINFLEKKREILLYNIRDLLESVESRTPCSYFVTFSNYSEALSVYNEGDSCNSNCRFTCRRVKFAPRPCDVLWNSVHSSAWRWTWWSVVNGCLLVLVIFCSTPGMFSKQIENFIKTHIMDPDKLSGVSTFLPPLLLLLFNIIIPIVVKISTITCGNSSRPDCVTNYMLALFGWFLCSTLAFPVLLSSAGNLIEFTNELSGEDGMKLVLNKLECAFSADAGAFYINLLLVAGLFKCQFQLHRLGNWAVLLYKLLLHGRSPAEREVIRIQAVAKMVNRSGNNMSLAEEYVWLLIFFTIFSFFCISCPLITPAFMLYLVCKYCVDSYLFRDQYTALGHQPELLTTAVKLTMWGSLATQVNTTMFLTIRLSQEQVETSLLIVTLSLLLLNTLLLIIFWWSGWQWPIKLFSFDTEDNQYYDDYTNPLLQRVSELDTRDEEKTLKRRLVGTLVDTASHIPGVEVVSKLAGKTAVKVAREMMSY